MRCIAIDLKSAQQHFGFVFVGQVLGGRKSQREPGLIEFSAGVLLKLRGQRRNHVEGGVHSGKFFEHANHAPVILQCMQARPRQDVAAGGGIAILRLVHVPKITRWIRVMRASAPESARDGHARMTSCLGDAHHRSLYFPRSSLPRVAGAGRLHFRLFRSAARADDGSIVRGIPARASEIAVAFPERLPSVLSFSLPIAVLVGVLIGLGRMSADSELIAMNALGMGVAAPAGAYRHVRIHRVWTTLAMTLWLGPASIRTMRTLEEQLARQPSVFVRCSRVSSTSDSPPGAVRTGCFGRGDPVAWHFPGGIRRGGAFRV